MSVDAKKTYAYSWYFNIGLIGLDAKQSLIFAIPDFKLFHPILHVLLMQSCPTQNKTKSKQIKPDQAQTSYYIGLG